MGRLGWHEPHDIFEKCRTFSGMFATLFAIAMAAWSTWATIVAFVGGTIPPLGIEIDGGMGSGLLWLFIVDPVIGLVTYWVGGLIRVVEVLAVGGLPTRTRQGGQQDPEDRTAALEAMAAASRKMRYSRRHMDTTESRVAFLMADIASSARKGMILDDLATLGLAELMATRRKYYTGNVDLSALRDACETEFFLRMIEWPANFRGLRVSRKRWRHHRQQYDIGAELEEIQHELTSWVREINSASSSSKEG